MWNFFKRRHFKGYSEKRILDKKYVYFCKAKNEAQSVEKWSKSYFFTKYMLLQAPYQEIALASKCFSLAKARKMTGS